MLGNDIILNNDSTNNLFEQDTKSLGQNISEFIMNFYPSYGVNNEMAVNCPQENSLDLLNSFTFYKMCECTIDNIDDKFQYFAEKMKKLFTTAYSMKQEVCYGIVSNHGKASLVLGIAPGSNDARIKRIIEGLLPGIKIEKYAEKFTNSKIDNKIVKEEISQIAETNLNPINFGFVSKSGFDISNDNNYILISLDDIYY